MLFRVRAPAFNQRRRLTQKLQGGLGCIFIDLVDGESGMHDDVIAKGDVLQQQAGGSLDPIHIDGGHIVFDGYNFLRDCKAHA